MRTDADQAQGIVHAKVNLKHTESGQLPIRCRRKGNALSAAFKQPIALMTDTGYARQAQIGARFTF